MPQQKPQHAFSTKCVSDHTKPVPHTTAPSTFRPPTELDASAQSQNPASDPGEGLVVPEHKGYGEDLPSGFEKLKKQGVKLFKKFKFYKKNKNIIKNILNHQLFLILQKNDGWTEKHAILPLIQNCQWRKNIMAKMILFTFSHL